MNARKWIWTLLLLCVAVIGVQLIQQIGKQVNLYSSLGAMLMDYNTVGEEAFRKKVLGVCGTLNLEVDPEDLRITTDKKTNRLFVQLTCRQRLWILFIPWERTVTVKQEGALVEL